MADRPFRVPPEVEDVATQVGDFIEYWGFKNVHGRIWTHLFLAKEPLDATCLVERLGISKALVSMSISDLLEYEVIQVAGKSSRSTTTYRSNPDLTNVIMNILRKRERRMLARVSSSARLLKSLPAESQASIQLAPERVEILGKMIQAAESALDCVLKLSETSFEGWADFNNIPVPAAD